MNRVNQNNQNIQTMNKNRKFNRPKQHIVKSTGLLEVFSAKKLERSLQRTGLRPKDCKEISKVVAEKIKPGTSTHEIFKDTVKLIRQKSTIAATHYSLKQSILELGPTGYEFEYFVSKYFEEIGFKTYVGVIVQGEFVRHEVDIVASKPNFQSYIECKFHNNSGRTNDIKIVLYIKARWDDLKNGPDGKYLREFYVASNTAFSKDALDYARGTGLQLLGVNAPEGESFLDKIKKHKLYPITSLKKLKKIYCQELLLNKIILCKDLLKEKNSLIKMGMSEAEIMGIFNDINKLIN
ncbi:MAG: restriction endonuclease [Bacteriovorax sp.]|nr:restriction endonuclease [Bacteriovorax sp.]